MPLTEHCHENCMNVIIKSTAHLKDTFTFNYIPNSNPLLRQEDLNEKQTCLNNITAPEFLTWYIPCVRDHVSGLQLSENF